MAFILTPTASNPGGGDRRNPDPYSLGPSQHPIRIWPLNPGNQGSAVRSSRFWPGGKSIKTRSPAVTPAKI